MEDKVKQYPFYAYMLYLDSEESTKEIEQNVGFFLYLGRLLTITELLLARSLLAHGISIGDAK